MLAYVFWHWPGGGAASQPYEQYLGSFHAKLAADAPDGYVSSAAFRSASVTWVPNQSTVYEDWYLITDFEALGELNEAAVSGSRVAAHDQVAVHAAGGAGGVYRAVAGAARFAPVRYAAWMSKPRGMKYAQFFASLAPWTSRPDLTLWQRQLVLGPAPEFCLHAVAQHDLPPELQPIWVELSPVWLPA